MKRLLRRFAKTRFGQALFTWELTTYLRLIHATTRWRRHLPPATERLLAERRPFIACFWHGRLAVMRAGWQHDPADFHMLISRHSDGAIIAEAMRRLGFDTIGGSSRRGGSTALREMRQRLTKGHCVGITPDGPRGPRMRAKIGALKAAQVTGAPIVAVSGAVTRCSFINSWDRACLPTPFGFARGDIVFSEPLAVPAEADRATLEALRLELEQRLNAATAEADRLCGLQAVAPQPAEPAPGPARKVGHARA